MSQVRFISKPDTRMFTCNRGLSDMLQRCNMILENLGKERERWSDSAQCKQAMKNLLDRGYFVKLSFSGRQDDDNDYTSVTISLMERSTGNELGCEGIGYLAERFIDALETEQPKTESKKMQKAKEAVKVVGTGMLDANKTAFGMAATMQTGRANNKVIKEAVRPLVKLMFKPSFMQRLLAKIFKTENPIDKFLDSPYGGLFAAQLAQGIVTMKGIENEKVKAVTVGGIAYAYNELADEVLPVENAIDSVVKQLTAAAEKVVK